jgi:DNA-binding transcriptional LysR family regulator
MKPLSSLIPAKTVVFSVVHACFIHINNRFIRPLSQLLYERLPFRLIPFNDLVHHNCLLFSYSTGYDIWRFKRDTEICEIKVSGSLVANNSEVIRQVCLDGAGLILMPTWLIGGDIRVGRLQAVLSDFQVHPQADMDMGIYALYMPNRRHSLRVKTFIEFLMKRFCNPPYWDAIAL